MTNTFYSYLVKPSVDELVAAKRATLDRKRLDFLSDPTNEFSYSIKPDGRCQVQSWYKTFSNLREALDFALIKKEEKK